MKILILKDSIIDNEAIEVLKTDFASFIKGHTDINVSFYVEERDFQYYPTFVDGDGDTRPTDKWLRATMSEVYKKYKEDIDHVFLEIHEDHWQSKRIWGTAYGNVYSGYQVHYCRFDKDNPANTFGIFYHEWMHTNDTLVKTYLNVHIAPLVPVPKWDKFCVHGGRPGQEGTTEWKYIRYQENTKALKKIGPQLKAAYKKRRELYFGTVKRPLMLEILRLSEQVLVLLRQTLNRKNGVGR